MEAVPPFPPKYDATYFAHSRYLRFKRVVDVVLSLIILILTLPIMVICAIVIRLTWCGPAFCGQVRLGLFGQPYRNWKLRTTLVQENENKASSRRFIRNDPRVTSFGRFLRLTHIDDLPQLWNVLKGDMSLVGPRPERPEFIPLLEASIPHFRQRMLARPGLTGLAQVSLAPDTGVPSVRRKVHFDLYYIRAMGPLLDLQVLLAAALQFVGVPSRLACWAIMLPGSVQIHGPSFDHNPSADNRVNQGADAMRFYESPPHVAV